MKTYMGFPSRDAGVVTVTDATGTRRLDLRLDLSNHSPTGFNWGYGGSGPAQLALALLADALGDDDRALRLHQLFKFKVVANWDMEKSWTTTDQFIRQRAGILERERATPS